MHASWERLLKVIQHTRQFEIRKKPSTKIGVENRPIEELTPSLTVNTLYGRYLNTIPKQEIHQVLTPSEVQPLPTQQEDELYRPAMLRNNEKGLSLANEKPLSPELYFPPMNPHYFLTDDSSLSNSLPTT